MDSSRRLSTTAGSRFVQVSLSALAAGAALYLAASLVLVIPIAAAGWLLCLAAQGLLPASAPGISGCEGLDGLARSGLRTAK